MSGPELLLSPEQDSRHLGFIQAAPNELVHSHFHNVGETHIHPEIEKHICGPDCAVHSRPEALAEANSALDDILSRKSADLEKKDVVEVERLQNLSQNTQTDQTDISAVVAEVHKKQMQEPGYLEDVAQIAESESVVYRIEDKPEENSRTPNETKSSDVVYHNTEDSSPSIVENLGKAIKKRSTEIDRLSKNEKSENRAIRHVAGTSIATQEDKLARATLTPTELITEVHNEKPDTFSVVENMYESNEGVAPKIDQILGYDYENTSESGDIERLDDFSGAQVDQSVVKSTRRQTVRPTAVEVPSNIEQIDTEIELVDVISDFLEKSKSDAVTENTVNEGIDDQIYLKQTLESVIQSTPKTGVNAISFPAMEINEVATDEAYIIERICDLAVYLGFSGKEVYAINLKISAMPEKDKNALLENIQIALEQIKNKQAARDRKVTSFTQYTNRKQERENILRQLVSAILSDILDFDSKAYANAS